MLLAFSLTLFAGLATGIGSLIAFFAKGTNYKFLSGALGFSAGVMLYVSFVEIFQKARASLSFAHGEILGTWFTVIGFFGGIFLIGLIDKLIPTVENPYEIEDQEPQVGKQRQLMRMGMFTALAIAIHNFPEGLATFTAALVEPALGVSIAVAIAIHNIPEGIAVSAPIYYATGSKKKAFWYSFLSGLAEPIGALLGYWIFATIFNDTIFGIVFAGVAGMMVYIAIDELLPAAQKYSDHHISIYGMVAGMAIMALSLLLFL